MRRRHGFATMYVSHKSVGVGVLDDPAARPPACGIIGRVRIRYVLAGVEPRQDIISKRRRRFTASRETAGGDDDAFASTTSVDNFK